MMRFAARGIARPLRTLHPWHDESSRQSARAVLAAALLLVLVGAALAQEPPPKAETIGVFERLRLTAQASGLEFEADALLDQNRIAEATAKLQQALAIYRRLFPQPFYPSGDPNLAACLFSLAHAHHRGGDFPAAQAHYEQALAMNRRLYPADKYPQGHEDIVLCLTGLAIVLQAQAEYAAAHNYLDEALQINRRLYPAEKYPKGHVELAASLSHLGHSAHLQGDYGQARDLYLQALDMRRRLYPESAYPRGHLELAQSLHNLGALAEAQANWLPARRYHDLALQMLQRLYPANEFPDGHPLLARSLSNFGVLLASQGEYALGRGHLERSLEMHRRLYPVLQFPKGHPDIARALDNLASVHKLSGDNAAAQQCYEECLAMRRRLYSPQDYPHGHPALAAALNNLGEFLHSMGQDAAAQECLEEALAMWDQPAAPQGGRLTRLNVARLLNNLASVHASQGRSSSARDLLDRSLRLVREAFPADEYPLGHVYVATTLSNLGCLEHLRGNHRPAREFFEQATAMFQALAQERFAVASEVEALNYVAHQGGSLDGLLSVAHGSVEPMDDSAYAAVWRERGAIQRAVAARQRVLAALDANEARQRFAELLKTRRDLAQLAVAPAADHPDHVQRRAARLQELTRRKEELERDLAALIPEFRHVLRRSQPMPEDLARRLPPGVALVDFVRFDLLEQDPRLPGRKGERRTPSYVAFVLQRNRPVQRAALGPAEPIEEAVAHWRQAIRSREPDAAAAAALRKLVWEPIEPLLPPQEKAHPQPPSQPATPDGAAELGTATIYLCPDGRLSSIPWAALPGRVPGGVLLEEYQLAVLPHGQYLLQMFDEAARESASGACLVVGDVRYNEPAAPRPQKVLPGDVNVQRGAAGTVHLWAPQPLRPYDDLEGAAAEVESLIALCEKTRIDVRSLRRADATTDNVLSELPAARVAHFATHGFLADPRTAAGGTTRGPSELRDFLVPAQRTTILSRNPLALSGIVLAGANLPRPVDASGIPQGDGGILSAEAIAALHCPQLELVVLSACETGLGDVAGGEGVYGLQRAFHTAGARNVVASLWSVGDLPTLALMKLMYRQLWVGRQPPIAALRQAQLYIYRHPHHIQRIAELSPDQLVKEPLAVLEGGGAVPPAVPDKPGQNPPRHAPPPQPAHTFHWAGFVLSGAGR